MALREHGPSSLGLRPTIVGASFQLLGEIDRCHESPDEWKRMVQMQPNSILLGLQSHLRNIKQSSARGSEWAEVMNACVQARLDDLRRH
jgi:hypothetical protein